MASTGKRGGAVARLAGFLTGDHRFVFLGTSAYLALGVLLSLGRHGAAAPAAVWACRVVAALWLAASAVAGAYKLGHWEAYSQDAPFVREGARRTVRLLSYVAWAAGTLMVAEWFVGNFLEAYDAAMAADSNPQEFLPAAIYMISQSGSIMVRGIQTTIALAFFGTVIAFAIALVLVFLRIQTPDRGDSYLVRFLKVVGCGFAKLYITIIRGTPMMVQGLIIYYTGFNLFKSTGMGIGEVQGVWSFFIAGLVTLSVCSAAYMAEVLRASIEAIDPGQLEAARSLGLTQWQGMRMVVFPQGVKNAIPAISNELIINIKDSSVLSVIGVFDLMYATTSVAGIYFRQMELYVATALVYLCLTYVAGKVLSALSARMGMRTRGVMSADPTFAEEMIERG